MSYLVTAAAFAIGLGGVAHAQPVPTDPEVPDAASTGSLTGHTDPGLAIEVRAADGSVVARATADAHGDFRVAELAPGRYDLVVTDGTRVGLGTADITAAAETRVALALDPLPPGSSETIHVESTTDHARLAERSAEAVRVVTTEQARRQTADLGEVLARTEGVAVRRSAGLGSTARFSLDGLYDDQIRLFLDEVPLDIAGYPFGLVNVPVNLVDRVEIYRGVVPIRFGADALGGAVNLVSARPSSGTHASASYQSGSFGTHRASLAARHQDDATGLDQAVSAFFDRARNDYAVDVQAPDAQGRLHDVTVPRFHDGYTAAGATGEVAIRDRRWADRLELRGFYTGYAKELQSNSVMTVPFGEVTYGERVGGGSTRYRVGLGDDYRVDALVAYAHERITFRDESEWVYDWFGKRILARKSPGEIDGTPHDEVYWQNAGFARLLASRRVPLGEVRVVASSQLAARTGADRDHGSLGRDPLSAHHRRTSLVGGVEWELDALDDVVENVAFAKSYLFRASYEDVLPGPVFKHLVHDSATFGGGDGVRWHALPWLDLKASYEYATRLPSSDELFGDGVLVGPSLGLSPETSHNLNVGPRAEIASERYGELTAQVNGFWRGSKNLIVLLGSQQYLTYQNVYDAHALGLDAAVAWASPGRWVTLDASSSYLELRNASSRGTFGSFDGDRIPNRPYLFASAGARGRIPTAAGIVEPFYVARYVHSFLRGWESLGRPEYQEVIPTQLAHDVGATLTTELAGTRWSATVEVDNVTDARLFDAFGAQRPGRAFYLKVTADL